MVMFAAILSKTWWRSLVKGDQEAEATEEGAHDDLDELEEREASSETPEREEDEEFPDEESEDDQFPEEEIPARRNFRATVENAKDFFAGEVVYRYDILSDADQEELRGTYRVEVKGNKGGTWTLVLGEKIEVLSQREEAEVVLSLQQRDFMLLVNGDLNPQMALLSQKVRLSGDVRRGVLFQSLLAPPSQE